MDSMPIRTLSKDAYDFATEHFAAKHVEHVNAPAKLENHEYLPNGIAETEVEKRDKWFIGKG